MSNLSTQGNILVQKTRFVIEGLETLTFDLNKRTTQAKVKLDEFQRARTHYEKHQQRLEYLEANVRLAKKVETCQQKLSRSVTNDPIALQQTLQDFNGVLKQSTTEEKKESSSITNTLNAEVLSKITDFLNNASARCLESYNGWLRSHLPSFLNKSTSILLEFQSNREDQEIGTNKIQTKTQQSNQEIKFPRFMQNLGRFIDKIRTQFTNNENQTVIGQMYEGYLTQIGTWFDKSMANVPKSSDDISTCFDLVHRGLNSIWSSHVLLWNEISESDGFDSLESALLNSVSMDFAGSNPVNRSPLILVSDSGLQSFEDKLSKQIDERLFSCFSRHEKQLDLLSLISLAIQLRNLLGSISGPFYLLFLLRKESVSTWIASVLQKFQSLHLFAKRWISVASSVDLNSESFKNSLHAKSRAVGSSKFWIELFEGLAIIGILYPEKISSVASLLKAALPVEDKVEMKMIQSYLERKLDRTLPDEWNVLSWCGFRYFGEGFLNELLNRNERKKTKAELFI